MYFEIYKITNQCLNFKRKKTSISSKNFYRLIGAVCEKGENCGLLQCFELSKFALGPNSALLSTCGQILTYLQALIVRVLKPQETGFMSPPLLEFIPFRPTSNN